MISRIRLNGERRVHLTSGAGFQPRTVLTYITKSAFDSSIPSSRCSVALLRVRNDHEDNCNRRPSFLCVHRGCYSILYFFFLSELRLWIPGGVIVKRNKNDIKNICAQGLMVCSSPGSWLKKIFLFFFFVAEIKLKILLVRFSVSNCCFPYYADFLKASRAYSCQ